MSDPLESDTYLVRRLEHAMQRMADKAMAELERENESLREKNRRQAEIIGNQDAKWMKLQLDVIHFTTALGCSDVEGALAKVGEMVTTLRMLRDSTEDAREDEPVYMEELGREAERALEGIPDA